MKKLTRIMVATGAVAVTGAAAAAVVLYNGEFNSEGESVSAAEAPSATAEVVRRDLARSDEVDGTLSYGEVQSLPGMLQGTVTWLPEVGSVIKAGDALYDIDNRPVVLLDGVLPQWRPLAPGTEGPDVEQLEKNLAALGYDGFTVDEEYTDATAEAVEQWQDDIGAPQTGTVGLGEVVFLPASVRVADHSTDVGGASGGPILGYTGEVQQVSLELEVVDQDLVAEDQAVTVTLPDDTEVAGTVTDVSTTVNAAPTEEGAGGQASEEPSTIEVTVAVDDPESVGDLESAPVKVELVSEVHEDVLVVPVESLLALREGGYGIEVVEETGTRLVAVETGIFATGLVEVSGDDLKEGMTVVVPE